MALRILGVLGFLAQLVERLTVNQVVLGSSPREPSKNRGLEKKLSRWVHFPEVPGALPGSATMKANKETERIFIQAVKEGKLSVSKNGYVFNNITNREIGYVSNKGYKSIGMKINGKTKHILVHRLMYLIHIGDLEADVQVNHKDGNKLNNVLSNFEPVSSKENNNHARALGLYEEANQKARVNNMGHKGNSSKLSKKQALKIRELYSKGNVTGRELADQFGVHKANIHRIIRNESYVY